VVDVTRRGFGVIVAGVAASVLPFKDTKVVEVIEDNAHENDFIAQLPESTRTAYIHGRVTRRLTASLRL
jgi:hypothetical protein